MEKPLENPQATAKNASGLNTLDIIALVSAAGGSVASLVFQQVAFAAIPLSASVALHVFNRKQLMTQMADSQQAAIAQLNQQISQQLSSVQKSIAELNQFQQKSVAQLSQQTQAHQTSLDTLSGQLGELQKFTANLNQETHKLNEVVLEMREIQEITQKMSANPNSAEFYFQRGFSQERLGDKQKAIEDYGEAIRLDPTYANAYFHRGMLNKDIGHRKMAVEDFRKAAKYFLEQGDIGNYQKARNLSQGMHDFRTVAKHEEPETNNHFSQRIPVSGLFE
ncbi:MAG: tetratricopeptide repeat protein [Hydrococcus sp. C42_A2020_068]|nr:tetratricopeptide repeat protein [Hydrococcus sp. C42_A2020_068]